MEGNMAMEGHDRGRFPGTPESPRDRVCAYGVMRDAAGRALGVPVGARDSAAAARVWLRMWADEQDVPVATDAARWLAMGSDAAVLTAMADLDDGRCDGEPISRAMDRRIIALLAAGSRARRERVAMALLAALCEPPAAAALWTQPGPESKTCGVIGELRVHVSRRQTERRTVIDEVTVMVAGSDSRWYTRPALGGGDPLLLEFGRALCDVAREFPDAFRGDQEAVHDVCMRMLDAIGDTVLSAPVGGARTLSDELNVEMAVKALAVCAGAAAWPWEAAADQLPVAPGAPGEASLWQRIVAGVFPGSTWRVDGGRVLLVAAGDGAITVTPDGAVHRHDRARGEVEPPLDEYERRLLGLLDHESRRVVLELRGRIHRGALDIPQPIRPEHIATRFAIEKSRAYQVLSDLSEMGCLVLVDPAIWRTPTLDGVRPEDQLRTAIRDGRFAAGRRIDPVRDGGVVDTEAVRDLVEEGVLTISGRLALVRSGARETIIEQDRVVRAILRQIAEDDLPRGTVIPTAGVSRETAHHVRRILLSHRMVDPNYRVTRSARIRARLALRDADQRRDERSDAPGSDLRVELPSRSRRAEP